MHDQSERRSENTHKPDTKEQERRGVFFRMENMYVYKYNYIYI